MAQSDADKAPFQERANADKQRHTREMAAYVCVRRPHWPPLRQPTPGHTLGLSVHPVRAHVAQARSAGGARFLQL